MALKENPADIFEKGIHFFHAGNFIEAIRLFDKVIRLAPKVEVTYIAKGTALNSLGDIKNAVINFEKALKINPNSYEALNNLGNIFSDKKKFHESMKYYDAAINLQPKKPEAYNGRATVFSELNRHKEALLDFEHALSIQPDHASALNGRGIALMKLGRINDAIESINRSIAINPKNAKYHNNLGNLLSSLHHFNEAIEYFNTAILLEENVSEYYYNRGAAYFGIKNYSDAIKNYEKCLEIDQHYPNALGEKQHTKMLINDWTDYEDTVKKIEQALLTDDLIIQPFIVLNLIDNINVQRNAARLYDLELTTNHYSIPLELNKIKTDRIRIGYFSSDFRNHPVCHLFSQIMELHQREKFEIHAFSFSSSSEDPWNKKIREAAEYYWDVSNKTNDEVVRLARSQKIDIAIDMNGHTMGRRIEIFLSRAAPIQVNYLGYPGTSACGYIDYIIADQTVIPPALKCSYSEKIVYLPDCYQANSNKRELSKELSRKDMPLPSHSMIYCCFNQNNKITPIIFDVWMRILSQVDNAFLWLWVDDEIARQNLKKEAKIRAIDPDRLIFAFRVPVADHLSRLRHADLFLDTLPYNAHTSASDALRMGLPVLTCQGNSFVSRVASSLLGASGIPELITTNLDDYEKLAVRLGKDHDYLSAIKEKLKKALPSCALFDSIKYTKNLEKAYLEMFNCLQNDTPVDHINIKGD